MSLPPPDATLCLTCKRRKGQPRLGGLCRGCYDAKVSLEKSQKILTTADFSERNTGEAWLALAKSLGPVYRGVADGTVKATPAQAAILKSIWERAYGRVSKSQEDKAGAHGIVLLPIVGSKESAMLCPNCRSTYDQLFLLKFKAFLAKEGKSIVISQEDGRDFRDGGIS